MKNSELLLKIEALEKRVDALQKGAIVVDDRPIKERLTTYKACFEDVKSRFATLPDWLQDLVNVESSDLVPMWLRVYVIVNALNGGKLIQKGQKRYCVWFEEGEDSGWFFNGSNCGYGGSFAGSRLNFLEEDMPKFYADNFKEEINAHMSAE